MRASREIPFLVVLCILAGGVACIGGVIFGSGVAETADRDSSAPIIASPGAADPETVSVPATISCSGNGSISATL